jgi:mono/diheme cytochrome c family protein
MTGCTSWYGKSYPKPCERMNTKTAFIALAAALRLAAQTTHPPTVWDGVYTAAQAARGKTAYDASCASCHGETLAGRNGRALAGPRFFQDWGEDSLNSLFNIIVTTMPRGEPHSLDEGTYVDITAYILEKNEYPAGATELTADRVEAVRVIRKDGPGPVPNFALVTVVGCLVEPSADLWVLRNSCEPVRTRNPDASQGAERERSEATPLGTQSFELMDIYQQGLAHRGHKMEVKGLLIRGVPNRVNITAMQMIGDRCEP